MATVSPQTNPKFRREKSRKEIQKSGGGYLERGVALAGGDEESRDLLRRRWRDGVGKAGGVGEDAKREEPILGFNLGFGVRVGFWLRGLSWWIGSAADSEIGLRLLGLNTCKS